MIVRFGNLSVSQFEEKVGVTLSEDDRLWFNEHRQDNATVTNPDKLSIFDMPLGIHCGSNIVHEAVKRLTAYGTTNYKTKFAIYD